jgi:hypothetical protein
MLKFCNFIENKLTPPQEPEAREAMRDIQIVFNTALGETLKTNGYGIDKLEFELINQEKAQHGIQLNLEAKGTANAKNKEHLSRMLQKLVEQTREPLWQKKVFLEMMYHEIHMNEVNDLHAAVDFNVICAAIIFN